MIGKKISGRYEVLERVGGGGMAVVYKAKDELLNRVVALKVLRSQYALDDDFVLRFRREAQAAASLSHPNIVSIYDVGMEEDVYYIVMEYVAGSTLKEYIQERAPLESEEAIEITKQIAEALEHAHQNQIIHRDIKPHNILINKDKRIKVTDFGIARAVSSATITHTNSVIGSVHYFSPEQARGGLTGEKSDIYSLGVVLYEMLTGELPFSGDSPISVALKHLQEEFEDPRKLNPRIPQSVENIILRSLVKDPMKRYSSAIELIQDLQTCLHPSRIHEDRIDLDEDYDHEEATKVLPVLNEDMFETKVHRNIKDRQNEEEEEWEEEEGEEKDKDKKVTDKKDKDKKDKENDKEKEKEKDKEEDEEDEEEEKEKSPSKRKVWGKFLISLVLVLLLGFGLFKSAGYVMDMFYVKELVVEDVTNKHVDEATEILRKQGFQVHQTPVYNNEVEEGYVVTQMPVGGGHAKENSIVRLTVSQGKEKERMRSFRFYHEQTARNLLRDFKDVKVEFEKHPDISEGLVIRHEPEANEWVVPSETTVTLVVSSGSSTVRMPNLIGTTLDQAKTILLRNNLEFDEDKLEEGYSDYNKGIVYRQHPVDPNQEVEVGTPITLWVSKGKKDGTRMVTEEIRVELEENEVAKIAIYITDLEREEVQILEEQIESSKTYSVNVKVSPMQDATITVYKNGQVYEEPKRVTFE